MTGPALIAQVQRRSPDDDPTYLNREVERLHAMGAEMVDLGPLPPSGAQAVAERKPCGLIASPMQVADIQGLSDAGIDLLDLRDVHEPIPRVRTAIVSPDQMNSGAVVPGGNPVMAIALDSGRTELGRSPWMLDMVGRLDGSSAALGALTVAADHGLTHVRTATVRPIRRALDMLMVLNRSRSDSDTPGMELNR